VDLLQGCQVFVLPSRSEPFGIVLVEAMACKKPVVSTTAGGIPEIIENQKNGILVEPDDYNALADALLKVLKDVNLRRDLGENGHATLRKRFRIEHTGSAYEALFSDLLVPREKALLQAA
jgi:glycosyltransferase involved in cell wall biosynthesis